MNQSELAGAKKDDVAWASQNVGVVLQNKKQQKETERPWRFYRRDLFRSEENIFLVGKNPIWMTIRLSLSFVHFVASVHIKFRSGRVANLWPGWIVQLIHNSLPWRTLQNDTIEPKFR